MSTGRQGVLRDRKHLHIDPVHPDPDVIRRAASVIRDGGVVVYPTTLLYGLGADALNPDAVDRVFAVKQRAATKPVSVLVNSRQDLDRLAADIPEAAHLLMDRLWPGKVTLVFRAAAGLPANLTAGTGKIGIRLPLHPAAKHLLEAAGMPVTATSANLSGGPGCASIRDMPETLLRAADLILDAGGLFGGAGSTVIDVTLSPPGILRIGAVSASAVRAALEGA